MSAALTRVLRQLSARAGGLPSLEALAASQASLKLHLSQPWSPQSRGFAASPSGGSGGGSGGGLDAPEQPKEAASAAREPLGEPLTGQQQEQQGKEAEEQHGEKAAPTAGGGGSSSATEGSSGTTEGQLPSGAEVNEELKKYIEGLKALKGSSTVQKQTVGGDRPWWVSLVSSWLGPMLEGWIADFVRSKIEREFDPQDFLEGATDAFFTVSELLGKEDWDALRPMMSAKLLNAFRDTVETYRRDGLVYRTAVAGEPKAGIRGMGFANKEMMSKYDPDLAEQTPEEASALVRPAGMWLVLTVQLTGLRQTTTISREEDGQVVAELEDLRPVRWKFATGPLPGPLPVNRMDTEWLLLSI